MRRLHQCAVSLFTAAALSGCSAAVSVTGSSAATASASATTASDSGAAAVIAVTGDHPVLPNGSQDTHAADSVCDSATALTDHALGDRVADGFALTGFPVSAALLRHFLNGTGTGVNYPAGSPISKKALASSAFRTVDNEVQAAVLGQLKAGGSRVRLSAAQLPTVAFESTTSDLYWGFRGTQGLTVTGGVRHEDGRYVGTLTYVIRDSYGFPASDTLAGFGPPMRYLQTVCGAPQHAGGARWFPDTITVTVPFNQAA